jgi:hypothetical protein
MISQSFTLGIMPVLLSTRQSQNDMKGATTRATPPIIAAISMGIVFKDRDSRNAAFKCTELLAAGVAKYKHHAQKSGDDSRHRTGDLSKSSTKSRR